MACTTLVGDYQEKAEKASVLSMEFSETVMPEAGIWQEKEVISRRELAPDQYLKANLICEEDKMRCAAL